MERICWHSLKIRLDTLPPAGYATPTQRDAMTSVVEIGFGTDTEKGSKTGDEANHEEWKRATHTFFLNSAAASFVSEIALFVVTTQITYNYKYVGS